MAKTETDPFLEAANKSLEGFRNPPKKENTMDGMEETMRYYTLDIAPNLSTLKVRADQGGPRSLEMFNDAITSMKSYLDSRGKETKMVTSDIAGNLINLAWNKGGLQDANNPNRAPDPVVDYISKDLIDFGKEFADYLKVGISRADDSIEEIARRFVNSKMEKDGLKALPKSSYNPIPTPKQGETFMEIISSGLMANAGNPSAETIPEEIYKKQVTQALIKAVNPYIKLTNKTLKDAALLGRKVALQPVTDDLQNNIFDKIRISSDEWDTVKMDEDVDWNSKEDFDANVMEAIQEKRAQIKYATMYRVGESIDNALEVVITPREGEETSLEEANKTWVSAKRMAPIRSKYNSKKEEKKPTTYLLYLKNSTDKNRGTSAYWLDQILSKPESFIAGEKANLYQIQQDPLLKWVNNRLYEKVPIKQYDEEGKVTALYSEQMLPLKTKSGAEVPFYVRAIQDAKTNIISGYQIFDDNNTKFFDSIEEEEKESNGKDYITLEDRLIEEKDGKRRTEKGFLKILREAIYNK